jgi:hypothetical protein
LNRETDLFGPAALGPGTLIVEQRDRPLRISLDRETDLFGSPELSPEGGQKDRALE